MTRTLGLLSRVTARLTIIVLLVVVVSGVTYAIAVSPVGATVAVRRPPGGALPGAATRVESDATASIDQAAVPSGTAQTGAVPAEPLRREPPNSVRPAGGRPGSLARGLPELAMHTLVILVIALAVAGGQAWLRSRRGSATSGLAPVEKTPAHPDLGYPA